jgi:hypothetical protein
MIFAVMEFDPEFRLTSAFVFWVFAISVVLTLGFTVAVFFGGIADVRFLLRALDEPSTDADDAGQTTHSPSPEAEASSHP